VLKQTGALAEQEDSGKAVALYLRTEPFKKRFSGE